MKAEFNNLYFIYFGSGISPMNSGGYLPQYVYLTIDSENK